MLTETAGIINCLVSSGYDVMADRRSGTGLGGGDGRGGEWSDCQLPRGFWACHVGRCDGCANDRGGEMVGGGGPAQSGGHGH